MALAEQTLTQNLMAAGGALGVGVATGALQTGPLTGDGGKGAVYLATNLGGALAFGAGAFFLPGAAADLATGATLGFVTQSGWVTTRMLMPPGRRARTAGRIARGTGYRSAPAYVAPTGAQVRAVPSSIGGYVSQDL